MSTSLFSSVIGTERWDGATAVSFVLTWLSLTLTLVVVRILVLWRQALVVLRNKQGRFRAGVVRRGMMWVVRSIVYAAPFFWAWLSWQALYADPRPSWLDDPWRASSAMLGFVITSYLALWFSVAKVKLRGLREAMRTSFAEYLVEK